MSGHVELDQPSVPRDLRRRPASVSLDDTVEMHETRDARDPEAGRDTERDFLLRDA